MYFDLEKYRDESMQDSYFMGLFKTYVLFFDTMEKYGIENGWFMIDKMPINIAILKNGPHVLHVFEEQKEIIDKLLNIDEFNRIELGLQNDNLSRIPDYVVNNCIDNIVHHITNLKSTPAIFERGFVDIVKWKAYYQAPLSDIVRRLCVLSKMHNQDIPLDIFNYVFNELDDIFTEMMGIDIIVNTDDILNIINKNNID